MSTYIITNDGRFYTSDYLCHHGIKGMKWGVRRYQNEDGTLTEAGKKRFVKQVQRADAKANPSYVRNLAEKGFDKYRRESESYNAAKVSKNNLDKMKRDISDQANRYAEDKVGKSFKDIAKEIKDYETLQRSGLVDPGGDRLRKYYANLAMRNDYLNLGAKEAARIFSTDKDFREALIDYNKKYRVAYEDAAKYVKDQLGKWGDAPMPGKNSIAVDLQSGKVRQQTVSERVGVDIVSDLRDD